MILMTDTDANYLGILEARSGIAGYYYFKTAWLVIIRVTQLQIDLF